MMRCLNVAREICIERDATLFESRRSGYPYPDNRLHETNSDDADKTLGVGVRDTPTYGHLCNCREEWLARLFSRECQSGTAGFRYNGYRV